MMPVPYRQDWLRIPAEKWPLVETLERFTQRCEELRARVKEGDIPAVADTREQTLNGNSANVRSQAECQQKRHSVYLEGPIR